MNNLQGPFSSCTLKVEVWGGGRVEGQRAKIFLFSFLFVLSLPLHMAGIQMLAVSLLGCFVDSLRTPTGVLTLHHSLI